MTEMHDDGIAAGLEGYRESRGIQAGPLWDQLLAWWRENQHGQTKVLAGLLDGELARLRGGTPR